MEELSKDSLGDRMKAYESISNIKLVDKEPVILRLDGKGFHTFTRGFHKPFDHVLSTAMQETMLYLCNNVQNCVFGYTQSDEITLVLVDYRNEKTSPWFDNKVEKLCSVAASMATLAFNKALNKAVDNWFVSSLFNGAVIENGDEKRKKRMAVYRRALEYGAMFDCRCFNLPKDEVINCLIWRQQDAIRNSVQMLGRAHFSDKQLFKVNCEGIKQKLKEEKNIEWEDLPLMWQRGTCAIKKMRNETKTEWILDKNIPIFTEDRNYIDKLVLIEEYGIEEGAVETTEGGKEV